MDIFVATVGTGGTISGTGKFLKEKNPDIQIIGVEPAGCPVLSGGEAGPHKIQGIGGGVIAPVTDVELLDEVITVTDDEAYETVRKAARKEGSFIGISAGAALFAATEVAKTGKSGKDNCNDLSGFGRQISVHRSVRMKQNKVKRITDIKKDEMKV